MLDLKVLTESFEKKSKELLSEGIFYNEHEFESATAYPTGDIKFYMDKYLKIKPQDRVKAIKSLIKKNPRWWEELAEDFHDDDAKYPGNNPYVAGFHFTTKSVLEKDKGKTQSTTPWMVEDSIIAKHKNIWKKLQAEAIKIDKEWLSVAKKSNAEYEKLVPKIHANARALTDRLNASIRNAENDTRRNKTQNPYWDGIKRPIQRRP